MDSDPTLDELLQSNSDTVDVPIESINLNEDVGVGEEEENPSVAAAEQPERETGQIPKPDPDNPENIEQPEESTEETKQEEPEQLTERNDISEDEEETEDEEEQEAQTPQDTDPIDGQDNKGGIKSVENLVEESQPSDEPMLEGEHGAADVSLETDEERPLERTYLGEAIDALMMHWCQFLTNVSVRPPVPPPSTLDHVKEVAEVGSKHFRDACVDVINEFYRIGVQWEIEEHEENTIAEERDLDEAIARQNFLLEKVKESLTSRTSEYSNAFPQAGCQYTT